jgi:hypothetical protein
MVPNAKLDSSDSHGAALYGGVSILASRREISCYIA